MTSAGAFHHLICCKVFTKGPPLLLSFEYVLSSSSPLKTRCLRCIVSTFVAGHVPFVDLEAPSSPHFRQLVHPTRSFCFSKSTNESYEISEIFRAGITVFCKELWQAHELSVDVKFNVTDISIALQEGDVCFHHPNAVHLVAALPILSFSAQEPIRVHK